VASQILRTLTVAQRISLLEQRLALYQVIAEYFEQHQVAIITL
jgi:hypothetical protein